MTIKKRYHQTGIRIEDEIYQELRQRAHNEWRTLSSQINTSLREGLKKTSPNELNGKVDSIIITLGKVLSIVSSRA